MISSWIRSLFGPRKEEPEPIRSEEPQEPERSRLLADFVLGLAHRPNLPVESLFEPVVLDEALFPGATVVGRLLFARPSELTWVVGGTPLPPEHDPEFPGLTAHLFVQQREAVDLAPLYRAAVLGCLAHPAFGSINQRTGQVCLRRLHEKTGLTPEEEQFKLELEQAPLFEPRVTRPDGPHGISLDQLRRAERVYLLPVYVERELLQRAQGLMLLSDMGEVAETLRSCGLAYGLLGEFEDAVLGDQRIVPSRLREQAVEVSFSRGVRHKEQLEYPIHQSAPLQLDLARRLVRGPDSKGLIHEIPFAQVTRADIDEKVVEGDLKTHRYLYLWISDGQTDLVYYERMKEYYETSSFSLDLENAQALGQASLRAIPKMLGVEPRG